MHCPDCGVVRTGLEDPGMSGPGADGRWRCDSCYLDHCIQRRLDVQAWERHGEALTAAFRSGLPPLLVLSVARVLAGRDTAGS